jgi:DNA-directed RNA polymerase specialized sigma24 family protein
VSGSAATPSGTAEARVAQAARASYGRLIGILSAPSNDIAGAEDALSDALQAALLTWPERGIPDNPEGWLVRVAKNRMTDAHRRALKLHPVPIEDHDLTTPEALRTERNDPRLPLLFVCAHPGIAEPARGPLMLQAVLGFTAAQIARAYVSSPAAMSKQLVRAKDRIKANATPFRVPDTDLRSARLPDVTEAIYGCYALVWLDGPDADSIQREAVYLADLLATELGDDPEVLGLSALLAFLHARRAARLRDGRYVPLAEQSTELWDHDLIAAADTRVETGVPPRPPGALPDRGRHTIRPRGAGAHGSDRLAGAPVALRGADDPCAHTRRPCRPGGRRRRGSWGQARACGARRARRSASGPISTLLGDAGAPSGAIRCRRRGARRLHAGDLADRLGIGAALSGNGARRAG